MKSLTFYTYVLLSCGILHTAMATTMPRTCLSCEGINCQRTTRNQTTLCLDPLDYCVTIYDKATVIRKGCSSELPMNLRRHCDANLPSCRKCFGSGCNDLGPINALCLQCDSTQDANCASNTAAISAMPCVAATASNTYCFVRYSTSSNGRTMITQRGCAVNSEDQQECYNSANCGLCLSSDAIGCNTYNFTPNSRYRSL